MVANLFRCMMRLPLAGAGGGEDGNIVAALDQQAGLSLIPPEVAVQLRSQN